jgi:hypothetical protein
MYTDSLDALAAGQHYQDLLYEAERERHVRWLKSLRCSCPGGCGCCSGNGDR